MILGLALLGALLSLVGVAADQPLCGPGRVPHINITVSDVSVIDLDTSKAVTDITDLFNQSCPEELAPTLDYKPSILVSSFHDVDAQPGAKASIGEKYVFPSSGSIVRGALEAWGLHQHLVLRPDEIWFEILTQLNFYMTAHAEDVRKLFVTHEGKEEILVEDFSWQRVVKGFGQAIQDRVKTDWLLDWIMPGFSTTRDNDELTATVLMMGLMQHHFEFVGSIICGLPRVTLLGTKHDWELLHGKLGHMKDWGEEPEAFARNLEPILAMFVKSWEEPESEEVKSFWNQIVRAHSRFTCGSAPEYDISGWITAFMHWKVDGTLRDQSANMTELVSSTMRWNKTYPRMELEDVTIGYAKAPLKMMDYPGPGENTSAFLLAGNIGVHRQTDEGGRVLARPLSSWYLYAPVNSSQNATTGPIYGNGRELYDLQGDFSDCTGRGGNDRWDQT